ncbi:Rab GTPase-binding effector protein 1 [Orchesella cincta]|uniref:Rab GTPase-binding effector protein 1 n=1 Tax=Orchesella cincta TaxID=48709 RepID=A0A1D2NBJ6_ORCCI|nr:Rab GTPase-binding effector protein 1 [Orchesella cincta]
MSTEETSQGIDSETKDSSADEFTDATEEIVGGNGDTVGLSSPSPSVDNLMSKNSELALQDQIMTLQRKLVELDADFGAKRARFKELFMQKEDELAQERDSKSKLEADIKRLEDELNESKSQVTIAELQKNDIEIERQRYQSDSIMQRRKYEESIKELTTKYDNEIQRLKHVNSKLEANITEVRETLSPSSGFDGPGAVFSTVGQHFKKSLARKINSTMTASNDSLHEIDDGAKLKPTSTSKYAQEDAEMLRSLVVQLEEELVALKEKVRNSDEQLAALQSAQASLVKGNDALTIFLQGKDVQDVLTQLDDKLRTAQNGLEAEKSSRADLEMYVAFANAQKTLLQDELDKSKLELRDLKEQLDLERKRHDENCKRYEKISKMPLETVQAKLARLQELISQIRDPSSEETAKKLAELQVVSSSDESTFDGAGNPVPPAPCKECDSRQSQIDRLKDELHKSSQFRKDIEEESNTKAQGLQAQLNALEAQMGTYELLLHEVNTTSQQAMDNMENRLKRLQYERDSIQSKIESLELENDNLKGKHVKHSVAMQNEPISLPNDVMELQELVLKLREDLISVQIGKETVEGELQFLKDQMKMIEEEKTTIEEGLNSEISSLRDMLTESKHRCDGYEEDRRRLEKTINDVKTKLMASEAHSSKIYQSKKQSEDHAREKEVRYESLSRENHELQGKIGTLRKELNNSEDLQKDLISLNKSLQMELEALRCPETEVRWQHPDDISQCKTCKKGLHDPREKHHCKHCGRICCPDCISRTIRRGNRDYNVCGFCHTLLAHDSAPYFSTEPPHSPD